MRVTDCGFHCATGSETKAALREEDREVEWRVAIKRLNDVFLRCLLPSKFGK